MFLFFKSFLNNLAVFWEILASYLKRFIIKIDSCITTCPSLIFIVECRARVKNKFFIWMSKNHSKMQIIKQNRKITIFIWETFQVKYNSFWRLRFSGDRETMRMYVKQIYLRIDGYWETYVHFEKLVNKLLNTDEYF